MLSNAITMMARVCPLFLIAILPSDHCRLIVLIPCQTAGLRIKETKEVYEGEVTELTPVETENPVSHLATLIHHRSLTTTPPAAPCRHMHPRPYVACSIFPSRRVVGTAR